MNNVKRYASRFKQVILENKEPVYVDTPDVVDSFQPLFQTIYAKDPVTGISKGDLAVFLNPNANPEVKTFIEMQLMQPVMDTKGVSLPVDVTNKFRSLSDDDVAKYSRNHGESREEYASRLNFYFAKERENRLRERDEYERKQWLERARNLDATRNVNS